MTAAAHVAPLVQPSRRGTPWSAEEDAFILANYKALGAQRTAELLGRTYAATCVRACEIKAQKSPHWTAEEDRRLRTLWGTTPMKEIGRALGRGAYACAVRGAHLGLQRGEQRGMHRLTKQAERTGFYPASLRRILAWAKVQPEIIPSCSSTGVDPRPAYCDVEVDEAVSRWLSLEVVAEGARARGVDRERLMELLMSGRFKVPKRPTKGPWRVPSELLDEAAAYFKSLEKVGDAARRHHLVPDVLLRWLREEGVTGAPHPRVRIERAVIDRVVQARRGAATA